MVGPFIASQGDIVEINFDVENIGTAPGTQDILLSAEDGTKFTVDTQQDLSLNEGEVGSGTLQWNIASDQAIDVYDLCIETDNGTDCVTVSLEAPNNGAFLYEFEQDVTDTWFNYPATNNGAQFVTDSAIGSYALEFERANGDNVAFSDIDLGTSGFSVAIWVKDTGGSARQYQFGIVNSANDNLFLGTDSAGEFFVRGSMLGLGGEILDSTTTSIRDGNYHLVGFSEDTDANEVRTYVDGNRDYTFNGSGGVDKSSVDGRFGDKQNQDGRSHEGLLDHARAYTEPLTDTEWSNLYSNESANL